MSSYWTNPSDFDSVVARIAESAQFPEGWLPIHRIRALHAVLAQQKCPHGFYQGNTNNLTEYECELNYHVATVERGEHKMVPIAHGLKDKDVFIQDDGEKLAALARIVGIS